MPLAEEREDGGAAERIVTRGEGDAECYSAVFTAAANVPGGIGEGLRSNGSKNLGGGGVAARGVLNVLV
jgi:hypothetical protein